jgi:hypothetical protein
MNDVLIQNFVNSNSIALNSGALNSIAIGTHNSGAIGSNFTYCLATNKMFYTCFLMMINTLFYSAWADCQTLTLKEQVSAGVTMFDLRYIYNAVDNQFTIAHTFPTIYTLYTALTDIFISSKNKSLITIKLEYDTGIDELYPVEKQLEPDKMISMFKTIADGRFYNNLILPSRYNTSFNLLKDEIYVNSPAVLLYSNNYVPALRSIVHNESSIFDSINTWAVVLLSSVKSIVNKYRFLNNGYPKMLHITWNAGGILTPFFGKYILSTVDFRRAPKDLYGIFIDNINDNSSVYAFYYIFNGICVVFYAAFILTVLSYLIRFIYRYCNTCDCNNLCSRRRQRTMS